MSVNWTKCGPEMDLKLTQTEQKGPKKDLKRTNNWPKIDLKSTKNEIMTGLLGDSDHVRSA